MTAQELLKKARAAKPEVKYVTNDKENMIGAWSEENKRYMIVAAKTLMGTWASWETNLIVNGKPLEVNWIV